MRERLWEEEEKVDLTSLIAHTLTCLLFAYRFYSVSDVARFGIAIGLLSPTGHRLTVNHARYQPMRQSYVATSTADVFVERNFDTQELESSEARAEAARDIATELVWYFGFDLSEQVFGQHLANTREYVSDV